MATRVYLLAHELNLDYQTVLDMAEQKRVKVRSHLNVIEPEEETLLRKALEKEIAPVVVEAPPVVEEEPAETVVDEDKPKVVKRPFVPGELVAPAPAKEKKTDVPAAAAPAGAAPAAAGSGDKGPSPTGERRVSKRKDRRHGRRKLDGAEIIRKLRGSRFFEKDSAEESSTPLARSAVLRPVRRPMRPMKRRPRHRSGSKAVATVPPKDSTVYVMLPVNVKDLSKALGIKAGEILGVLVQNSIMTTINGTLDQNAVELIALEFSREIQFKRGHSEAELLEDEQVFTKERPENLESRPVVVTFLGHVDHGKTSLLDVIKKSKVQESEAGGITQHMAAYEMMHKDKSITFLDTPGHAAFTEMRARGANVTDIVVLVVAADDGVMPQTEEAISHARAAEVPIVVALNKIDLPNANIMRAKQQLSTMELLPEEFGGDTVVIETSAVTKEGITELLDMLLLVAEIQDFKADPSAPATGHVLEARLTEGRGVVASLLVRTGTLRKGDFILAGKATGRVRALEDTHGRVVEEATPSMPVDILGLDRVPEAGDSFFAARKEDRAKSIAHERLSVQTAQSTALANAENLYEMISAGQATEIPLILKADVKGSIEPLRQQLEVFSTSEVLIKVLHAGVGAVTESDVLLAEASKAIIIGFHVSINDHIRSIVDQRGIDLRLYDVIYQAVDDIKGMVEGRHKPMEVEKITGHAEVRAVFKLSRGGSVAGCYMKDGVIARKDFARVQRAGKVISDRIRISSIKRFKDDVKEVKEGFECGIKATGFDAWKEGDIIEGFSISLVQRKLEDVLVEEKKKKKTEEE